MTDSTNSGGSDSSAGVSRRAVLCGLLLPLAAGVAGTAEAGDSPVEIAPMPPADQPLSRVALGACHKLDRPFTVWNSILAQKPQLFVFLGDTVYLDTVDMAAKKAMYDRFAAVPEFVQFRQKVPIVATWDDHDYGANDGGADYPMREQSQKIFLDFFREPADSVRRRREGVYNSYLFGPRGRRTQVILLDTRYFRTTLKPDLNGGYLPQRDPAATMLGEAQWKWLAEQLRADAELRLIVSSIQVEHEDQPNEKWLNIPAERERLFKTIVDSKARGVVFISGDRHHGEISAMDIGAGYPIYEITSSGLNCPYEPQEEPNRHRIGEILWTENFAMVQTDWDANDPAIKLQVRTGKGEIGLEKEIPLGALRR